MKIRSFLGILVCLSLIMNIVYLGNSWKSELNDKITLIFEGNTPTHLDPALMIAEHEFEVFQQIGDGLVTYANGSTFSTQPAVAKNWTSSSDKLTYTFFLNQGIKFHDGTELTAKDVKYSFERAWPVGQLHGKEYVDGNITIKSLDNYTLEFKHKTPAPFNWILSLTDPRWNSIPKALYYPLDEVGNRSLDTAPVSCGPFKFGNWGSEDNILLERFEHYYGHKAEVEYIEFNYFSLRLYDSFGFSWDDRIDIWKGRVPGTEVAALNSSTAITKVISEPSWSHGYFQMNIAGENYSEFSNGGRYPHNQTWMRRVYARAFDRTDIVRIAFAGLATPAEQSIHPKSMKAFPGLNTSGWFDWEYDSDWARSQLDAHGHTRDFDWYTYNSTANIWIDGPDSVADWNQGPDNQGEGFNRFGYGPYMNDTDDDGNLTNGIATQGHHFVFAAPDCDFCALRAFGIYSNLLNIGIYSEVHSLEWYKYEEYTMSDPMSLLGSYNETTGNYSYNTTTAPTWKGSKADFWASNLDSKTGLPSDWINFGSHSLGYYDNNHLNGGFGPDPWWEHMTHELYDKGYEINSTEWLNIVWKMGNRTSWDIPHLWLYWENLSWVMKKEIQGFIFMENGHLFAEYLRREKIEETTSLVNFSEVDSSESMIISPLTRTSTTHRSGFPFGDLPSLIFLDILALGVGVTLAIGFERGLKARFIKKREFT